MNHCEIIQYFLLNNSVSYNMSTVDLQYILDYCNVSDEITLLSEMSVTTAVAMTIVYLVLLATGVIGNVFTCAVIARNRYMHTATNCYLFSLAISDLLLLVTGIPYEVHTLWVPQPPFTLGEATCVLRGFTAETSAYASVLTIAAFTVERYLAICHPLKAQALSGARRASRSALVIWVFAATAALPVALQFGLIYRADADGVAMPETSVCTLKKPLKHAFLVSAIVFFCAPLVLIFILYVKIGLKLRKPLVMIESNGSGKDCHEKGSKRHSNNNRKGIIKMLVAVVICFFLCWSPFHSQRIMATYISQRTQLIDTVFVFLNQVSGVSYYLSATLDPLLYHLMSRRFRKAFSDTFCCQRKCDSRILGGNTEYSSTKAYKSAVLTEHETRI